MKNQQEIYGLRVWVDAYKAPPKGWVWMKDFTTARVTLRNALVGRLSFRTSNIQEGLDFVKWMAQENLWPSQKPEIHTYSISEGYHLSKLIDELFPGKERSAMPPAPEEIEKVLAQVVEGDNDVALDPAYQGYLM